jgi:hypothetical protein
MMRALLVLMLLLTPCCAAPLGTAVEPVTSGQLASLCITHGSADTSWLTSNVDPELRGYAPGSSGTSASLSFSAFGDTTPLIPLASGAIRRQICLKLRAADGCNLIYACWRLGTSHVVVQVKSNPGMHDANACGVNGYSTMAAAWSTTVPTFLDGQPHSLAADLDGASLQVAVDGASVWDGAIDPVALTVDGPVGIRSDNERWTGSLRGDIDCGAALGD